MFDEIEVFGIEVRRNSQDTDFFRNKFLKNFESILALFAALFERVNNKSLFVIFGFESKLMVFNLDLELIIKAFVSYTVKFMNTFGH